jgi:uncharacterized protein YcfJ
MGERMHTRRVSVAIAYGSLACAVAAFAETPPKLFVSPSKGQSQQQQPQDTAECQEWATQQAPPPQGSSGAGGHTRGTADGAARGAAMGAAVGGIAGNAGTGAGAGAVIGGVAGRRRSNNEQQAADAGAQNDWARAFAACMESRGYVVK